jgi:hypothetical protein
MEQSTPTLQALSRPWAAPSWAPGPYRGIFQAPHTLVARVQCSGEVSGRDLRTGPTCH